jgi:hypothetical protein
LSTLRCFCCSSEKRGPSGGSRSYEIDKQGFTREQVKI